MIVSKIVLTGGPGGGKTTALSRIKKELTERGYRVLCISESATEIINTGIKPFGSDSIPTFDFQNFIMEYQLKKEQIFECMAEKSFKDDSVIIVYDRGAMDNKAYIDELNFRSILKLNNVTEVQLLSRYDKVIHLITAADGAREFYTLANNKARSEAPSDAVKIDRKLKQAWNGHQNYSIIDNSCGLNEKINRVMRDIYLTLGDPIPTYQLKRFIVAIDLKHFLKIKGLKQLDIQKKYLTIDGEEKMITKTSISGDSVYNMRTTQKESSGTVDIFKQISEDEYYTLDCINSDEPLIKNRYCFNYKNQYFKLDALPQFDDVLILEIDQTDRNREIIIPEWLKVKEDITDNYQYTDEEYYTRLNSKSVVRKKIR